MKYEVLKSCIINGLSAKTGDVLDIAEQEAKELLLMGRVIPSNKAPVVENRSVGLESSVEAPKTRTIKKKAR
tara:strand:- start:4276 stop:4491 length:216 start_codon:yes stop_codon:yes gene_type:complete